MVKPVLWLAAALLATMWGTRHVHKRSSVPKGTSRQAWRTAAAPDIAFPGSSIVGRVDLEEVRQQLRWLEDSLLFAWVERSRYPVNTEMYTVTQHDTLEARALPADLGSLSFLDYTLRETERLHTRLHRYTSSEECPFFPELLPSSHHAPPPGLRCLYPNKINLNDKVKSMSIQYAIPMICPVGNDRQTYLAASIADVVALQALSKRIHLGKFIAEAKFQAAPFNYIPLVENNDTEGILQMLTNATIEVQVLKRMETKLARLSIDSGPGPGPRAPWKLSPQVIRELYQNYVIPLTKEVEVQYLMQRVNTKSVAIVGSTLDMTNPAFQATVKYFGKAVKDVILMSGAADVLKAVLANEVLYGVILMEDSAVGSLPQSVLFEMFCAAQLMIQADVYISVVAEQRGQVGRKIAPIETHRLRYVVVAKDGEVPKGRTKTALCVGVSPKSMAIQNYLQPFQTRDIPVLSIQSHLLAPQPVMFVEVQGRSTDSSVEAAIEELRRKAPFVAVVGSFLTYR